MTPRVGGRFVLTTRAPLGSEDSHGAAKPDHDQARTKPGELVVHFLRVGSALRRVVRTMLDDALARRPGAGLSRRTTRRRDAASGGNALQAAGPCAFRERPPHGRPSSGKEFAPHESEPVRRCASGSLREHEQKNAAPREVSRGLSTGTRPEYEVVGGPDAQVEGSATRLSAEVTHTGKRAFRGRERTALVGCPVHRV
jgi:hypothetical protein